MEKPETCRVVIEHNARSNAPVPLEEVNPKAAALLFGARRRRQGVESTRSPSPMPGIRDAVEPASARGRAMAATSFARRAEEQLLELLARAKGLAPALYTDGRPLRAYPATVGHNLPPLGIVPLLRNEGETTRRLRGQRIRRARTGALSPSQLGSASPPFDGNRGGGMSPTDKPYKVAPKIMVSPTSADRIAKMKERQQMLQRIDSEKAPPAARSTRRPGRPPAAPPSAPPPAPPPQSGRRAKASGPPSAPPPPAPPNGVPSLQLPSQQPPSGPPSAAGAQASSSSAVGRGRSSRPRRSGREEGTSAAAAPPPPPSQSGAPPPPSGEATSTRSTTRKARPGRR